MEENKTQASNSGQQPLTTPSISTPQPSNPKSKLPIFIIGVFFSCIILGIAAYIFIPKLSPKSPKPQQNTKISPAISSTAEVPTTLAPTTDWKTQVYTCWTCSMKVKYPPNYFLQEGLVGFTLFSNSQQAYQGYSGKDISQNDIIISVSSSGGESQHSALDSIQFELNMKFSKPYLVNHDTVVPWENANGGTYDGELWYYPNVPYDHISINGIQAARYTNGNTSYYYIPNNTDNSIAMFTLTPNNSSLINVFNTILSSYTLLDLSTWKEYAGKDFTFNYPNGWLSDNSQVYDPSTVYKGGNGGNATLYKNHLWFTEVASKQTVDQYVKQYYESQPGFKSEDIPANIKGESVKFFYNPIGEGTFGWYAIFSNGTNIFLFGPSSQDLAKDKTYNAIINSFYFNFNN